jgi:hypothetical protein
MSHHVALVRPDVSEERSASIIKVTRICDPYDGGDTFSETSILTRATVLNIPEDGIVRLLHFPRLMYDGR